MFGRSAIAISPSCTWHAACKIVPPSARPRTKVITHTPRTPGRGQTGGREPDRRWPDFGLTVTPNADNCCTLLRNVMASQRQNWLVKRTRVDPYGTEGTPCEAESRRGWRGHRRAGRRGRCGASRCRLARGDPATTSSRTLIFTVHFSPFEALHLNPPTRTEDGVRVRRRLAFTTCFSPTAREPAMRAAPAWSWTPASRWRTALR
jgi:hypothetical protein